MPPAVFLTADSTRDLEEPYHYIALFTKNKTGKPTLSQSVSGYNLVSFSGRAVPLSGILLRNLQQNRCPGFPLQRIFRITPTTNQSRTRRKLSISD